MLQTFHICPICKLPGFREQRLCRHCAHELRPLQQPVIRSQPDFTVRSLFSWDQKTPKAVSQLIYALKGVEDSQAWLELALWMTHKFPNKLKRPVIVPIPGLRPNHAHGLAAAISRVTGAPIVDALIPLRRGSQKARDRDERRRIEFTLRSDYLCTEYRAVTIVDDVVTTGATAQAAYEALLRPKSCEVWCLADRRSCGG